MTGQIIDAGHVHAALSGPANLDGGGRPLVCWLLPVQPRDTNCATSRSRALRGLTGWLAWKAWAGSSGGTARYPTCSRGVAQPSVQSARFCDVSVG
jgi:hypothetical protein